MISNLQNNFGINGFIILFLDWQFVDYSFDHLISTGSYAAFWGAGGKWSSKGDAYTVYKGTMGLPTVNPNNRKYSCEL
jgi:hypothetical protein